MKIEMFPLEVQKLQEELMTGYHHTLTGKIAKEANPELNIEVIAAHCGILLDGHYSEEDLTKLHGILYEKLVTMREDPKKTQGTIILLD